MINYVNEKQLELFKIDVIDKFRNEETPLMQILQESQKDFGCVPIEVQQLISDELNISTAKINGVVTFYSMFSLTPSGKHIIGVCTGTACYVKGAQRLVELVSDLLDTPYGETTKDKQFTLAPTRCVGDCSKAPVVMVDGKIYGNVTSDDIPKILAEYQDK
ncbi:MAG: NAD(P)H-dependent oxidoreductase subunit E [Candidatus Izemoplasma sp.]